MIRRVYRTLGGKEVTRLLAETDEDRAELERLIAQGKFPEPKDALADFHGEIADEDPPQDRKAA